MMTPRFVVCYPFPVLNVLVGSVIIPLLCFFPFSKLLLCFSFYTLTYLCRFRTTPVSIQRILRFITLKKFRIAYNEDVAYLLCRTVFTGFLVIRVTPPCCLLLLNVSRRQPHCKSTTSLCLHRSVGTLILICWRTRVWELQRSALGFPPWAVGGSVWKRLAQRPRLPSCRFVTNESHIREIDKLLLSLVKTSVSWNFKRNPRWLTQCHVIQYSCHFFSRTPKFRQKKKKVNLLVLQV